MVPGSRESELAVGGDNDVGNEVVVSVENTFWVTECVLISGQLPDDDGFVYCKIGKIPSPSLDLLDWSAYLVKP